MKVKLKIWRQKNAQSKGRFEIFDFDGASPEGGLDVKAAILPIRLFYETSNPLT